MDRRAVARGEKGASEGATRSGDVTEGEKEKEKDREEKGSNAEDPARRRGGEKVRAKWRQEVREEAAETHTGEGEKGREREKGGRGERRSVR